MLAENLVRKLGIRPGDRIALVNAPSDFPNGFRELLPGGVELSASLDETPNDLILWWPDRLDNLDARLSDLAQHIPPEGAIWLAWQMLEALRLSPAAPGHRCLPLWRRYLAGRSASRRALAARGADRWFE